MPFRSPARSIQMRNYLLVLVDCSPMGTTTSSLASKYNRFFRLYGLVVTYSVYASLHAASALWRIRQGPALLPLVLLGRGV